MNGLINIPKSAPKTSEIGSLGMLSIAIFCMSAVLYILAAGVGGAA